MHSMKKESVSQKFPGRPEICTLTEWGEAYDYRDFLLNESSNLSFEVRILLSGSDLVKNVTLGPGEKQEIGYHYGDPAPFDHYDGFSILSVKVLDK